MSVVGVVRKNGTNFGDKIGRVRESFGGRIFTANEPHNRRRSLQVATKSSLAAAGIHMNHVARLETNQQVLVLLVLVQRQAAIGLVDLYDCCDLRRRLWTFRCRGRCRARAAVLFMLGGFLGCCG